MMSKKGSERDKKRRVYVGFTDLENAYDGSIGRHYGKY